MSKIFEALQRAQQSGNTGGNPQDAFTPPAAEPETPRVPPAAESPLWETQPPLAPAPNSFFVEQSPAANDLLFGSPAAPPAGVPSDFGSAPPYSAQGSAGFAPPNFASPNFASPNFAPPNHTPPSYTPPSFAPPGQVVPSLPLAGVDQEAPTVWEEPSLVRFSPRSKVVVAQNPTSLAAEQYRVLRTNIVKLSQTQALKVILVTSPGPGDGKTLTTMNLALSFCQKPETRVLLIEADLRKPSVGALVAMNPGPGLSDYLSGEATLEQVVRPTSIPNFHLLDSGKRAAMPADLLHSPRLANMMETLRSHFNWIVLDGPPTNPVADYELLTPICDGVILVVRPFYTQRDLLRLTTEALRGRKVLGCVVNGSKHFERYGNAYGYGYGYGPSNQAEASDQTQRQKMRRKKRKTTTDPE